MKKFLTKHLNNLKPLILRLIGKKYIREGQCLGCGSCCQHISIKNGRKVIKTPEEFEKLQRKFPVYRMFRIMDNIESGLVFQCVYLDLDTGWCTDYENRPPICRNYPNEVIFKIGGALKDCCGYQFKPLKPFKKVFSEVKHKHECRN